MAEVSNDAELKGIGGWLILPLVGLIVGPIFFVWMLVTSAFPHLVERSPGRSMAALTATLVVVALPYLVFQLWCLVRFLQERRNVPQLMTGLFGLNIALVVLSFTIAQNAVTTAAPFPTESLFWVSNHPFFLALRIASNLAWIAYFHNSIRVKNTFVVTAPPRQPRLSRPEPTGIGGWLILPLALVVLWTGTMLFKFVQFIPSVPGKFEWSMTHGSFLPFRWLLGLAILGVSLAAIYLFIRRKRLARWLLLAQFLAWSILTPAVASLHPEHKLAGPILVEALAVTMVAYFMLSKRVKNTFVY